MSYRPCFIAADLWRNLKEGAKNMSTGILDWNSRLVAVPRRGEHPRQGERRMVVSGYPLPVSIVFENLEAGVTIDEIMEWFDVTREQM